MSAPTVLTQISTIQLHACGRWLLQTQVGVAHLVGMARWLRESVSSNSKKKLKKRDGSLRYMLLLIHDLQLILLFQFCMRGALLWSFYYRLIYLPLWSSFFSVCAAYLCTAITSVLAYSYIFSLLFLCWISLMGGEGEYTDTSPTHSSWCT